MRVLVFAAKWVGRACIEHLLDNFPGDEYTFVVGEPEAATIVAMLERRGHPCLMLGAAALATIHDRPDGHFDWLLNLWGGHIFRAKTLAKAHRSLNIHPAYLPYCRGRDPVVWAIRRGYPAGVTLHAISEAVDAGPIWYREKVPYDFPTRGGELYERVVDRCLAVFCEQWAGLRDTAQPPLPQAGDESWHTFRRSELPVDRCLDLDGDLRLREAVLRLLAHDFAPGYTAQLRFGGRCFSATLDLLPTAEETAAGPPAGENTEA